MLKSLILVRGVPGTGKSTLARKLSTYVFETDDFFIRVDGVYDFRRELLNAAHQHCQDQVNRAMMTGVGPIVVANTFTTRWEMAPYYVLAERHHYTIGEIVVGHAGFSIEELAARTTHAVPAETIRAMIARWED